MLFIPIIHLVLVSIATQQPSSTEIRTYEAGSAFSWFNYTVTSSVCTSGKANVTNQGNLTLKF
jgi:hypothetical protein